ncbi:enoyl-CoA hydratase/isomerase family protein [Actinocorallia sp. A-T 12471]|uniref:enoyl-CoA hydratase/isomerase family protein n=1 Tax=Actinocorallia sp. A-T 12471 TaxID=3089813 RepID=UPI0029D38978|nr:enoyl-CoA hydratase/isomerase family protein [Actinocorallia sp. A-T 12471]MDX6743092.1 enoyl-CoA hydratase/isomerase family protein [Actinocorallia sp. A-T 12471]
MIKIEDAGSGVSVLRMTQGENRFSPDFLDAFAAAIDEVEGTARAVVTTGEGKFYSNGLDLDWLSGNGEKFDWYLGRVHALYGRLLGLNLPTVAAVNGHAFAGGGMLALAHDFSVMRADRGWFCLPEIDLEIPFSPAMVALIQAKLPKETVHEAALTGRRYTGPESVEAGIAHHAVAEDEVLGKAVEIATGLAGKSGKTFGAIRRTIYRPALTALTGAAESAGA